jgi:Mg2+ and Co2+ transporter CorA
MAIYGPRGPGYAHKEYRPYHIQDLQYWHDKTNEAVMVLDSNVEVLKALRRFYIKLKDHKDFPDDIREACADDVSTFAAHLDEIIDDLKMQISRAKLLSNIISDRKELVLQHLQGQAAERTEKLNQNLEREAIVMRIITTVTLIYLPATFVSVRSPSFVRKIS